MPYLASLISCLILILTITPSNAETLVELYAQAELDDLQLRIAEAEVLATSQLKGQAQAALRPQLSLGASATQNLNTTDWMINNHSETTQIRYNLSLQYALYRRNLNLGLAQVDSVIERSVANYTAAQQDLILRLATAFFNILAAKDNLIFTQAAKDAFNRQLDQATKQFEVGLIAITDVQEAQAAYDSALAEEIRAANQIDNSIEILREITGRYHTLSQVLSEDIEPILPEPQDIEAWTKIALQHNPQILAARHAIATAQTEIRKQRAANLPTVDLIAQHGYRDTIRGDKEPFAQYRGTDNSISIQFNYFLYEGGGINARVREAQQRYTQSLDQLMQVERMVQNQTRQAYLNVSYSISRIQATKQALNSSQTVVEAVQVGYEVGTRTSVDVLNARRDLLRAQLDYATARYDYILSTLRLKQAAGLIVAQDLEDISDWLVEN
jgi:outer membrane protein